MDSESKRERLLGALRHLTPDIKETLRNRKEEGLEQRDRPDFVWHSLLQSFATMGNARGWDGLVGNKANYNLITFEAFSGLDRVERLERLDKVLRASKVRMPGKKAVWLDLNHEMIVEMGEPEEARRQALAHNGREGKVAFMQRFHSTGDKYARNIWMDVYHPDFRNAIAVDERIKRVTEALRYSFENYAEHERFYQEIAREVNLEGWEVDRLLYNHQGEFLAIIDAGREETAAATDSGTGTRDAGPTTQEASEKVEKNNRLSSTDLVALSKLPRTLEILEKTLDKGLREALARFAGNKIKRKPTNIGRQIREEGGYFIYASLTGEMDFDCYAGFGIGGPDDYPTIIVGLYVDPQAIGSEVAVAAIKRISSLTDWHDNLANQDDWPEVWRETSLLSVLQDKDHFASVKGFFTESISQLNEELTTFKEERPDLPWDPDSAGGD
jgi:hypothetical protein